MIDDLMEAAPIGLGVLGRDRRYVRANAALAALAHSTPEAMIGRRPSDVVGAGLGRRAEEAIEIVLDTGAPLSRRVEGRLADEPDVPRAWDVTFFPVADGVGIAAIEVTERAHTEHALVEAHRRDALMARAGQVLSTALTVQETADLIAHVVVPELADWCFVELAREGRIDRVAWAHRDPERLPWIAQFDRAYPLDPDAPVGSPHVIRTGEAEVHEEIPDELLVQAAVDEEHLRLLRGIGLRSSIVVPLVARGRTLGDLVLATDGATGRRLGPADLPLARELADRCAVSLDNASLYEQRDLVAMTLQEELLPPRLPAIPGIDVAARYSAAGEGNEVGGDFYDVFPSGGGWQVVIGDVVGKGPAAAAITGLARHTMRTAAAYEGAPSQLLRVLNEALLAERTGERMATVACVRIEPDHEDLRLTVSAGGHPLPLVVGADGAVREVGRHGQLLGVEPDLLVFNVADRLRPGELLVLFTDGVVEVHGPSGRFGEQHLRALLADSPGDAPTRVLRRIESAVLAASGGRPRDDVAMVALRRRPEPAAPDRQHG